MDVVKSFVKKCCIKSGAKEEHASDLADLLVVADHRGHFSHDLNRLGDLQHFYIYWFTKVITFKCITSIYWT